MSRFAIGPEASWAAFDRLVSRVARGADPAALREIVHVGALSGPEAEPLSERLQHLYSLAFDADEVMDAGQQAVAIAHGFHETWLARDSAGAVTAALQAQLVDLEGGAAMLVVWYVAAVPGLRTPARELFTRALADSLAAARARGRAVAAIVGETRPAVERTFNRYGLRRVYYRTPAGRLAEVPYRVPNDDLSDVVSEHLILIRLDGRADLEVAELLAIVRALHHEYLRPEYYTPAALRASERHRGHPLPMSATRDEASAAAYRDAFSASLARCRAELEHQLRGAEALVLLGERERRQLDAGAHAAPGRDDGFRERP